MIKKQKAESSAVVAAQEALAKNKSIKINNGNNKTKILGCAAAQAKCK
jgi:hypothetical protein